MSPLASQGSRVVFESESSLPQDMLRGVADVKIPTTRKTITLSLLTVRRLELLAQDGWFGSDVAGVATSLVEAGVRRARSEGYLTEERLAEARALTERSAKRGRRSRST